MAAHPKPLPPKLLHIPAVLLGGPTRAAVTLGETELWSNGTRGSVVGEAVGSGFGPHALGDESPDFEDPFPAGLADPDGVADDHALRRFDRVSVDADVPGTAGSGGGRAGLVGADRPKPGVDADICRG